jgi:phosphopantetheine--protein transferase-like protein
MRRAALLDRKAAHIALRRLFEKEDFPTEVSPYEILWLRDPLGKPYLAWQGRVAEWAEAHGRRSTCVHVSNTHDGGAHIVLMVYGESLVGLGVDVVHLPRLRQPGKDIDYLHLFARRFMSEEEWTGFAANTETEDEEAQRRRVAAHFSLMESASKACGTGLKIGAGLGRTTSLSKQSLGVRSLSPSVELLFGAEARARLTALGADHWEAYVGMDDEYLVSAVLLHAE